MRPRENVFKKRGRSEVGRAQIFDGIVDYGEYFVHYFDEKGNRYALGLEVEDT
jgi:hypothetical protein